ncbi:MAG: outer membrane beta-barrel protein [Opitutaceae bacterium]|nr:outer membrane beta-barrel protein [Opitutaceae bacterium]
MKHHLRLLAISLAAASAAYSAPFLAVGDGAELFLTAGLGVRADDNVFMDPNEVDDVIFDISPGVELVFGQGTQTTGSFSYTESISRYSDNDNLNAELSSLRFNSNHDDGKTKFSAQASFNQLNQNTVDNRSVGVLSRRDVTSVNLGGETSVSGKSKIGARAVYNNDDYKRAGFNDLKTFEIPVNYYYAVTSKVDLSLGARYRTSEVQNGVDSKDTFFRVGARGEFSPNVTGSVQVGAGQRDFDGGRSEDIFDLDAALSVALSPKSTLNLNASNDFGVSGQGQEQKNFTLGGNISTKVSDALSFRAGLTYRKIDYYSREDDYVEGNLGLDYIVNQNVSITGGYTYRSNDSVLAAGNFTNNVFSLAANLRY